VLFGEQIPPAALDIAQQAAAECDVLIVAGTSATVQPAAMIPDIARAAGGIVIEINTEVTPFTRSVSDYFIQGPAGDILSRMASALSALVAEG
jgi:NAD-dependent deacetylase